CWFRGAVARNGLAIADPDLHIARNDLAHALGIYDAQVPIRHRHLHDLARARPNMHTAETFQRAQGRAIYSRVRQVKFDNLITRDLAGILHIHARYQVVIGAEAVLVEVQITELKRGVTQAVAKRIEWVAGEVAIGAPLHVVVVERG